jgi:peroxiredoxin
LVPLEIWASEQDRTGWILRHETGRFSGVFLSSQKAATRPPGLRLSQAAVKVFRHRLFASHRDVWIVYFWMGLPSLLCFIAMKTSSLALAAALAFFSLPLSAQTMAPTAAPAEATAKDSRAIDEAIKKDLEEAVGRVRERLQKGQTAEADFSEELKAFDALSAKYSGEKTEAAAMIPMMKAMLYIQVFEKPEAGIPILKSIAADFPGTPIAAQIPDMVSQIEKDAAAEAATAVGTEFPAFKETATDGTTVDLAAYRGKIVLLDFWATWCGPCVDELPHVKAAYEKYHDKGFEIIGVSLDKDGDKLAAFTKEKQMPWPQVFDGKGWQSKLAQAYGIRGIPATFLLDREGKVAAKNLRGEQLSKKVAELLGK